MHDGMVKEIQPCLILSTGQHYMDEESDRVMGVILEKMGKSFSSLPPSGRRKNLSIE